MHLLNKNGKKGNSSPFLKLTRGNLGKGRTYKCLN